MALVYAQPVRPAAEILKTKGWILGPYRRSWDMPARQSHHSIMHSLHHIPCGV
nr:MAG TPA: hypothetical protein [Caudoviricetes sp.]